MDLRQLRYFSKITELGSFTAAAAALHVSQPALGMQIKRLEDEVGLPLLRRHSRGVATTQAGELLLSHAGDILLRVETAQRALKALQSRRGGTYRVGMTPSIARALATTLLERCTDQFADIELHFIQGFSARLAELVLEGQLDFAFSHRDLSSDIWDSQPLFVEDSYIFGGHRLFAHLPDPVSMQHVARLPLVLDSRGVYTKRRLDEVAEDWTEGWDVLEVESINILRDMVGRGNRCALSPFALFSEEVRQGALDVRRVGEPRLSRQINLVCRRDVLMSPSERDVHGLIRQLVQETVANGVLRWQPAGGVAAKV